MATRPASNSETATRSPRPLIPLTHRTTVQPARVPCLYRHVVYAHNTSLAVSGAIQSDGSMVLTGGGTLMLTAVNTYSGPTAVFNGTLEVDGALSGTSAVTVSGNGLLDGVGSITAPTTVQSRGALEAGTNSLIGTLTIANTLTLNTGSTIIAKLDKATATNDLLTGITTLTYGGTLTVTNLAGTLAAGDSFKLFSAASYAGNFATTNLPTLASGLVWMWAPTNGTLSVVSTASPPVLSGVATLSGTSFSLSFSGTSGQSYTVLVTTNLALPVDTWTPLTNGVFGSGPVNFTDTAATNSASFYSIKSP